MNSTKKVYLSLIMLLTTSLCWAQNASIKVVNQRCEFEINPLGVDVINPRLSWKLEAVDTNIRNIRQAAYQVQVASRAELLATDKPDLWDSGKITSGQMGQLHYDGTELLSSQKCWWRVKVWDGKGQSSPFSPMAEWTMGIIDDAAWQAEWITAVGAEKYALSYSSAKTDFYMNSIEYATPHADSPKSGDLNYSSLLAEKDIIIKPKLKRALIHISGLGHYEMCINGTKIGDYKLTPGWTEYTKTILYDTYDVTSNVKVGKNTLSVILANGMYNIQLDMERYVKFLNTFGPLKVIAQLQLEYADGTVEIVPTDKSWRVAPGPITYSNPFGGEDYDARMLPNTKWHEPLICKGPGGKLRGLTYAAPPIKAIESLNPIKITEVKKNTYIYDLGQNASIIPHIQVSGKSGGYIRIIPSELLGEDGFLDRTSSTQNGLRPAWWQYTLSGKGKEDWIPLSFYQGARYLQVELFANTDGDLPTIDQLDGLVIHASSQPIGTFECSNKLLNNIYTLVRWAQRSNMMSVMTDCPAREKLGWLEQTQLNGPALRYNFDMAPLFRKTMQDMADSQLGYGLIPNIAPEFFMAEYPNIHPPRAFRNSPEWGSAAIFVPWHQYLFSGDESLLIRYYDVMKRYVSFLAASAQDNIVYTGLGDWYDIGPKSAWGSQLTPPELTATATFYYDNLTMSKIARIIGNKNDEQIYKLQAEEIKTSFNKKFFNKESGTYSTNSQTANAMPLALGLVEAENEQTVLASIVNDIISRDNSQTSGEVGYRFLLQVLADRGYSDLIYKMINQSEKPGYGYQLKKGATSLTERWDPTDLNMGSQNHFMFGQINEWFFHDLAGIQPDIQHPGFRKFMIKPAPVGDLKWVKGTYQSFSGPIISEWRIENNKFKLHVSVPANTVAKVYIPSTKMDEIMENGIPLSNVKEILSIETKDTYTICEIGSGDYHFESLYQ